MNVWDVWIFVCRQYTTTKLLKIALKKCVFTEVLPEDASLEDSTPSNIFKTLV